MKTMNDLEKVVKEINIELEKVFSKPETTDNELKYIQLIIGGGNTCKGMREAWVDSEQETINLFYDTIRLIKQIEKNNPEMSIRLMLFLYSHLYEAKLIPRVIYNLLTLKKDGSYNERPFPKRNDKQERSTEYKIKDIKKLLDEQGYEKLSLLLDEIFNEDIRNSFAHSDYNFSEKGMVINCNRNLHLKIIPFDELSYQLNIMFHFFEVFLNIWEKIRKSYPVNYKFKHQGLTVTLKVDEKTNLLYGFTMGYE